MLPASGKEDIDKDLLKLAQFHTAIQKREHEQRRKMVIKNILQKEGDINYRIPETNYLKTFKPNLIGCSAIHLAFSENNYGILDDILRNGADITIKYNDMTVIHRAVEENFEKHKIFKLRKTFREQYGAVFDTRDINSFIIMNKSMEQKDLTKHDNWRLRGVLEDSCINSILSVQIASRNPSNPRSKNGLSHLHSACLMNNSRAVQLFLDNGVDVDETVNTDSPVYPGYKAIHFSVRCSGVETVRELLKYKVNIHAKDDRGMTALQILIDHNIKIVEWMSAKETLPYKNSVADYVRNEKIINLLIEHRNSDNIIDVLHLFAACTLKNTTKAESLVKKIPNINDVDWSMWPGYTALHIAAFFSMDVVKMLLKSGADIAAKDKNGITPLDIISTRASPEDIHFILSTKDAWKCITLSDGKTKLLDLILSMRNCGQFNQLLESVDINIFVPVDSPLWPGYSILHLAVLFSETSKVHTFLANVTDDMEIDYKKEFEKFCQEQNNVHYQKILVCLERKPNMNIQDVHGWTPVHLAFRQRKSGVVKFLQEHIEDLKNIVDQDNVSLLHIACSTGCKEAVEKLVTSEDLNQSISSSFKWYCNFYGCADDDVFRIVGSTPLHIAVTEENLEIVKLLAENGADVNAKDDDQLTPVHRIYALKNIWKIGDKIFGWINLRRSMLDLENPVVLRRRNAMDKFKDISKILLSSPTLITIVDSNFSIHQLPADDSPLRYNFESGETLLQQGIDILAKDDNGSIWLFDKLTYPYREDITFIITMLRQDEAMKTRLKQEFGWTTLHVACSLVNAEFARESLNTGIDVNSRIFKNSPIYPGCSPLLVLMMSLNESRHHREYEHDYEDLLHLLLDSGADVTLTDVNNDTPVHRTDYSTFWNSRSWTDSMYSKLLLEQIRNFNVNPINDRGFSIFHVACLKQNYRVVAEYLKRGVDVNQPVDFYAFHEKDLDEFAGYTPLHLALRESSNAGPPLDIVNLLLTHGADVHLEDAFGNTPLHIAAAADEPNEALLELIAGKGANVHAQNVSGKTPLETLLYSRRIKGRRDIDVFLKRGCRLNTFNPSSQVGYMALLMRCKTGDKIENCLDIALSCPSINDIDDIGRSSIHNIVANSDFSSGDVDVIEYFMKYGGDIDHRDQLGRTALHVAAEFRSYNAVKGLLSSGADINIVDAKGRTAFALALDPETSLVDLTLDFNVSKNEHLVIEVFGEFVYYMQLRGIYINDVNEQAQRRAIHEFHVRINEISSSFESIRNEKISSTGLILDDFMSETGAIVTYPKKSQIEREEIDQFFTATMMDQRFYEWRFLCKLQYRKALARAQLVDSAKDAMNIILDFPLPYLCFDAIQSFLSNADLKNLTASAT